MTTLRDKRDVPTPRTDAEAIDLPFISPGGPSKVVSVSFARQLERELAEANERMSLFVSRAAVERGAVFIDVPSATPDRNAIIEECAKVAMDMPLNTEKERHHYRWSDTGKAVSWDIAHAIRALKEQKSEAPQELPAVNSASRSGEPGTERRGNTESPRPAVDHLRDSAQQPAVASPPAELPSSEKDRQTLIDAARYRWLRENVTWTEGDQFSGRWRRWYHDTLSHRDAPTASAMFDAAVDEGRGMFDDSRNNGGG